MSNSITFTTPAQQGPKDYEKVHATSQELAQFEQAWNDNVAQWTSMSSIGNPWSNQNDAPRAWYFNPVTTGWPSAKPTAITWTPFPNRLTTFLGPNSQIWLGGQLPGPLSYDQLFQLADLNQITVNSQTWVLYDPNSTAKDVLQIPATKCPGINWGGSYMNYSPVGPRGWLDEYCEWSITWQNNQPGTVMQSITFTCENPAYWLTLWNQNPQYVLELYQVYADPAAQLPDLYLTYPAGQPNAGQPVIDPLTGNPAYNPTNRWNSGTLKIPGNCGGAMHLTSPPNTLSAEVYLAAASTIQRIGISPRDPQALICCAQYGQSFRNSDPRIGAKGNAVAETALFTLSDPVGLYIQRPNASLYQLPVGSPPFEQFWTVTRGALDPDGDVGMDSVLQLVFAVPPGAGFTMDKILVTDPESGETSPLRWAGQIAKTMQIALRVTTLAPSGATPPNTPMSCVADQPASSLQPWPAQFLPSNLFYGNSPTDLPSRLKAGTTVEMALVVQGASQDTTVANVRIQFDNPGVSAVVTQFIPNAGAIPGLTNAGGTQAYILQVTVAPNAQPGILAIRALNPDEPASPTPQQHPYEDGLASVVVAS